MPNIILLVMSILLVLSSGCAMEYHVSADAITLNNNSIKNGETYYIMPSNKDTSSDDLEFLEYASIIASYLNEKNLIVVDDIRKADNVLMLAYNIKSQTVTKTYNVPVQGIVGYDVNTYGYGNTNIYSGSMGHSYNSNSTITPQYGVVGYRQEQKNYNIFSRSIGLSAYAFKKDKLGKQKWKVFVYSEGSSGDLRGVFPYISKVLPSLIGTNTRGIKHYIIYVSNAGEKDEKIKITETNK